MKLKDKERELFLIALGGALASSDACEGMKVRISPDHVSSHSELYYLLDAIYLKDKEAVYSLLKTYGVKEDGHTVIESILNRLRRIVFKAECESSTAILNNTAMYNPEQFLATLDSIRERVMTYVDEESSN
ncbi:MAG: hypothetical protein CMA83_01385 [Euryarchaeota archaeon]|jgi:hypothetical protein|nr:hypothetical protein [Euryarchaeota archaeon]|tara:strand:+ start:12518 stop:12910 length:393 start_codon:yes stop_codon:yes gene_type:complete